MSSSVKLKSPLKITGCFSSGWIGQTGTDHPISVKRRHREQRSRYPRELGWCNLPNDFIILPVGDINARCWPDNFRNDSGLGILTPDQVVLWNLSFRELKVPETQG